MLALDPPSRIALVIAMSCLAGCEAAEEQDTTRLPAVRSDAGDSGPSTFELEGTWTYVGASTAFDQDTLLVTATTLREDVRYNDASTAELIYEILSFDEARDQLQTRVTKVTGAADLGVGDVVSARYVLRGDDLDLYLAPGETYPEPSGGTEGQDYFTYRRQ